MTLKLYECGLTDAIIKIEKLLDLALNVTNKWQASILVAEALGVARTINALVVEEDDTDEVNVLGHEIAVQELSDYCHECGAKMDGE